MLDRKDLDEVNRFLLTAGKGDLYTYYGVPVDCAAEELSEVLDRKRKWAQGQQSNPKYKNEALFLIKNHALLRRMLLEEGGEYRKQLQQAGGGGIEALATQIRQAIERGTLSSKQEAALMAVGRAVGLPEEVVAQQIARVLSEEGARREAPEDIGGGSLDLYKVLGAPPGCTEAQIEEAYRTRYRWARNLQDKRKSAEILSALDDAYRVLKDPVRRSAYDERNRALEDAAEIDNNTGIFPIGPRPEAPLRLAADGIAEEAMRRLQSSSDPFADEERPRDNTYVPESDAGPAFDPFAPGGSLSDGRPLGAPGDADPLTPLPTGARTALPTPPRPEPPPEPWRPSGRPEGYRTDPKLKGPPVDETAVSYPAPVSPALSSPRTPVPRLTVEGPTHYNLENPLHPVTIQLKVRNEGVGRMTGKISAKEAWMELSSAQLNPDLQEQILVVTIRPDKMPFGLHSGIIRIASDHGERRDISVEVVRPEPPTNRRMAMLGLASAAMLVGVIVLWFLTRNPAVDEAGQVPVELRVLPYADQVVLLDGDRRVQLGKDGSVFRFNRPVGEKAKIEVTSLGFAPAQQTLTVAAPSSSAELLLTPDIDMSRAPPANRPETGATVDVRSQVVANASNLSACFKGQGSLSPRFTAWVAGSSGLVLWVGLDPASEAAADRPCLHRVFRGMRFKPFAATDALVPVSGVEIKVGAPTAP